ncbi:cysteine hydrolase [Oxalobacter vibrioformis]|uniref:Cysteine hydrolase n=1 Tax=Oxalobacter vibrioformis TaxID=933080 RepID=A0A9E9P2V6_9BURK|nr:cysteine hydrolase family protein [Oxalobacter vibrioformis]WAW09403.1 cysteine hydrolase [Oxalobacter vibrioformis]
MQKQALIVVDIQNDYFPGGKWVLDNIETAAANAGRALEAARKSGDLVVHIRHEFPDADVPFLAPGSAGAQVHPAVAEQPGEPVIHKQQINAFYETQLQAVLQKHAIEHLVITGNMSHVCIDAIVRAAADICYTVTVLHDACATHDQQFNGIHIPAAQVQAAFMAALAFGYAKVIPTDEYLKQGR